MSWLDYGKFILENITEIFIGTFLVGVIMYYVINPYRKYNELKKEISMTLQKNSIVAHNTGLNQSDYKKTYDELRSLNVKITGYKNTTKSGKIIKLLGVPNNDDLDESIGNINAISNYLNKSNHITDIYKSYKKIKEIFNIK